MQDLVKSYKAFLDLDGGSKKKKPHSFRLIQAVATLFLSSTMKLSGSVQLKGLELQLQFRLKMGFSDPITSRNLMRGLETFRFSLLNVLRVTWASKKEKGTMIRHLKSDSSCLHSEHGRLVGSCMHVSL